MSVNNVSPGLRKRLAAAQDYFCPACGYALLDDLSDTEVDHIIPRARGGPNVMWNKRLVHFGCNRRKGDRLTEEASALAAQNGVTLCDPKPRSGSRSSADRAIRPPSGPLWREASRMYPRRCSWCDAQVVASTDDPEILIGCPDCDGLYDGSPPADQTLVAQTLPLRTGDPAP